MHERFPSISCGRTTVWPRPRLFGLGGVCEVVEVATLADSAVEAVFSTPVST